MKLIYIAGPFRGPNAWVVESNIRCAEMVGMSVASLGGVPVIPHTMYRFWNGTLTDEFWLNATLDILRRCDGAVFVDGWEQSAGSVAEHKEAVRLGLVVTHQSALLSVQFREWLRKPGEGG